MQTFVHKYWDVSKNKDKKDKNKEENKMITIGDKVKVVRKVKKENGWDNSWVQNMDEFIGKSGVVESIEDWGVNINFTDNANYNTHKNQQIDLL